MIYKMPDARDRRRVKTGGRERAEKSEAVKGPRIWTREDEKFKTVSPNRNGGGRSESERQESSRMEPGLPLKKGGLTRPSD
jgi:hypothetical protein